MAFWVYPSGHDMQNRINLDSLGQLYVVLLTIWSAILVLGISFLVRNRKLPFLRVRNLPLGILAVSTLHMYWCLCMLAYVMNGFFPCTTEYWIMSTYLPFGIALFQLNNRQLQHVAGLQQRIAEYRMGNVRDPGPTARGWRKIAASWASPSSTKQALTYTIYGMIAQTICALIIFCLSRRFHPSWGVFGTRVTPLECRKGWEWLPSIAWQFSWTWIYAPYLLWQIRNVQDVHGWRLQTVLCSVAGLLGSPMWLMALYLPGLVSTDKYWVPPLWFTPGILVMEASVIFVPCWQIVKSRKLRRETLDILSEWENKRSHVNATGSDSTETGSDTLKPHSAPSTNTGSSRRGEMFTMNALEKALQTNPTPLLLFAALRDFSGENISFLNHVREWKAAWNPSTDRFGLLKKPQGKKLEGEALRRQQFESAVQIYASFVGIQYSEFPVNLSFAHRKDLEFMFDAASSLTSTHVQDNPATPFDDVEAAFEKDGVSVSVASTCVNSGYDESTGGRLSSSLSYKKGISLVSLETHLPADFCIPESFGPGVFDDSEASIKYMVLTNTWPKFVTAGYANRHKRKSLLEKIKDRTPAWFKR